MKWKEASEEKSSWKAEFTWNPLKAVPSFPVIFPPFIFELPETPSSDVLFL